MMVAERKVKNKKTNVCDNCGRIMDELDQSQNLENKILCGRCFKQLQAQNDNPSE
jgi:hypothetical protein